MTLLRLKETDLHWREIDGEIIALECCGSRYVAANSAGTVLWRALVDGTTRDGLADELVRIYGIERERAVADVGRFVDALAEQGLLANGSA
jgi:Coenzyme PQQ synthesis protein D (PqqD)